MKHTLKLIALSFALALGGCSLTGGTALDERVSAEVGSAELAAFCQERKGKSVIINTAGFAADTVATAVNAVGAPVMVAVEGAAAQAIKNPLTQSINEKCKSVWDN